MVFSLLTSFFAVISAQGLTVQSDSQLRAEQLEVRPFTIQVLPGELSRHLDPTMDVLILAESSPTVAAEVTQSITRNEIIFQGLAAEASIEFQKPNR